MKWLWRALMLVVVLALVQNFFSPTAPKAFIRWEESDSWVDRAGAQLRYWQQQIQDLPASIEVEIKKLWDDVKPDGKSQAV